MLEIAIEELGTDGGKVAYVTLPANRNAVIDAMDSNKIFDETSLLIVECDEVPELAEHEFKEEPTLDELNFLAKRIEEISEEKTEILAYRALLQKPFDTINEAINRKYNLRTIPIYQCKNVYAYGKIVLENQMLEELDDVPDEVYDLLDPNKVGRAMMEHEGGVFVGGYYAILDSYEPALLYDDELPECMEDWVFRLEITGNPAENEDFSEKVSEVLALPADEEHMRQLAEKFGEKHIDKCVYVGFESAIPQISDVCFESMENIYAVNDIARRYSELSREDAAKFKAVLEHELWRGWNKINAILNDLDCYEFDRTLDHVSEFGEKYLSEMLKRQLCCAASLPRFCAVALQHRVAPPDFDRSLLKGACTAEFAEKIIAANECAFTEYGVISKCGGHLFSVVEAPEQEQTSDFEMGGIS